MNEKTKTCPICPRGCNLTSPHCGRGEEFARTGIVPQQDGKHSHGHVHEHGHRLQFEKKEQQLIMKYLHHAVGVADHGGITQENASEMFSVLTEKETVQLMKLLEKLTDHWMEIAPEKPFHHEKR
ncbi:MAG: hypothetical protein ACI4D8_03895 [Wujia sp.]